MKIFKNKYLLFNILNGLIPLIGILFLSWSVLDVFVLFVLELLILGVFTFLKIIFSGSKTGNKWSSLFIFCLLFPVAFLFIFILLGNFFDTRNRQMNYSLSNSSIYFLLGIYLFNFIYFYIIKGAYKAAAGKKLMENTFFKMLAIFVILLIVLLPIFRFVPAEYQGVLMGIAIAVCRLMTDNFIDRRLNNNS